MLLRESANPLRDGAAAVEGTWRLVALRCGLNVAAALPAALAVGGALGSGPARQPYFTDVTGALGVVPAGQLLRAIGGPFVAAMIAGIVLALLFDQLLAAGGLLLLGRDTHAPGPAPVRTLVFGEGLGWLWTFLRTALVSLAVAVVLITAVQSVRAAIGRFGASHDWDGYTLGLVVPLAGLVASVLALAFAGTLNLWARVLAVADGRRRVRRTAWLALRVIARHPLRTFGFWLATIAVPRGLAAVVLVAWRAGEPVGVAATVAWSALNLAALFGMAWIWHWQMHAALLMYASPTLADVAAAPDEPFHVVRRLAARLRRR